MGEQINNMSDEQLASMSRMCGMNFDPALLKQQANMFKNMDDN